MAQVTMIQRCIDPIMKRVKNKTITESIKLQWNLGLRTLLITNKSVHEQIFWGGSRVTNGVSGDERCLE
jgi:hypothetical protein